jgi:hypothetical protein
MRIYIVVGVLAAAAALANVRVQAQTHPCDQAIPPNPTIASGAPYKAAFCSQQSDLIEAAVGYLDGVPYDLLPVTAKTGPSSTGKILYETPMFIQVSRGAHLLTVATYNRNTFLGTLQLGAPSAPFPFGADDSPVPAPPIVTGISR